MTLLPSTGAIVSVGGAVVTRVKVTGVLAPVLPAASVSWAAMLWVPLPDSVTVADQLPPAPTGAVPTWVVTPFTVSNNVTVDPTVASPAAAATVPEIVCAACLVGPPALVMVTLGGVVSSVNTTGELVLFAPASWATMVLAPSPLSVTFAVHTPPEPTVVVPIWVVAPL